MVQPGQTTWVEGPPREAAHGTHGAHGFGRLALARAQQLRPSLESPRSGPEGNQEKKSGLQDGSGKPGKN